MPTNYAILKQTKSGKLVMWDGPKLTRQQADRLLKKQSKANPGDRFFIYKQEMEYLTK